MSKPHPGTVAPTVSRRRFLEVAPLCVTVPVLPMVTTARPETARLLRQAAGTAPRLRISGMELIVVHATARTTWLFVRLSTNQGLTGLGEASLGRRAEFPELEPFFELVRDESPFRIEQYSQRGWAQASSGDRVRATAFSAIEQAQWDLVGKALGAPVSDLFGGRLRDVLPGYANINRATSNRPEAA